MKRGKKRLALVFPPMAMPTSPPLGIAMLTGFIGRELPEWEVVPLDLNLWMFRRLFDGLASGRIGLSAEMYRRIGADRVTLLSAAACFAAGGEAFYQQPESYDRFGGAFLNLIEEFGGVLRAECEEWQRSGIASPLLAEMAEEIDSHSPDVVGISVMFSPQAPLAAMLGRLQRQAKGRPVYLGGGCFNRESAERFLRWYPGAADAIVVGDGEEPLLTILKGGRHHIPGVSIPVDGVIQHTPPVYQRNIDRYGFPDFSGLDIHGYFSPEPVAPLLLSRGCYWRKCAFCVHHFSAGNTYRPCSIEAATAAMGRLAARGVVNFSLVDEMISPGRFTGLARAIKNARLDIAYYALARPERGFTPSVLRRMAASGCRYILWGVESASQRVLGLMGKGTHVEEVSTVLRDAHAAGIANHVFILCGFPSETKEEWAATLGFLDTHKEVIQAVHRSLFSLEAGSPIWRDPGRFGVNSIHVRQETPLGPRLGYGCAEGMTTAEAIAAFQAAQPFFRRFHPYARYMANYRDHALLGYRHGHHLERGAS